MPRGSFESRPSRFLPGALGLEDEPPRAGKSSRRRSEFGPDGRDEGRPLDDPPDEGRPLDDPPDEGRPLDDPPDEGRPLDGRPEFFRRSELPRRSSMCQFSYLY